MLKRNRDVVEYKIKPEILDCGLLVYVHSFMLNKVVSL